MKSKRKCQQIHFARRSVERIGHVISNSEATKKILSGDIIRSKKLTNSRTEHVVELDGIQYRVVYDKVRKQCCTILPMVDQLQTPPSPF